MDASIPDKKYNDRHPAIIAPKITEWAKKFLTAEEYADALEKGRPIFDHNPGPDKLREAIERTLAGKKDGT